VGRPGVSSGYGRIGCSDQADAGGGGMSEDMFRQDRLRQDAIKQAAIRQDPLRADLLQRELPTHDLPTHDLSAQDQAARQLATLNRIARIAVQDLALRPMLQRIVDTLSNEFDWEFVACASIDRARNEFVCEAVCSKLDSDVVVDYRRALGTGVVGTCAQTGQTIDIDDAADHPLVIDTLNGTGSELCVPVLHNGEVLAVLNAESRRVGAFLGQCAMLETVADQIAGILRAAHLLEDLAETNRRLHAANRALEAMAEQDGLTGIANRRCFDRWVLEGLETSDREGRPLSITSRRTTTVMATWPAMPACARSPRCCARRWTAAGHSSRATAARNSWCCWRARTTCACSRSPKVCVAWSSRRRWIMPMPAMAGSR
jgi:putative methionine-R-sulfoxide reductase with GAF domain